MAFTEEKTTQTMVEQVFYPGFLLLVLLLGCFDISNSDIWWHLRTGQLMVERMRVPLFDWYSYTDPDASWIDLHWGFQLVVAALWKLGGAPALVGHKCLVAVATFAICLAIGRGKLAPWQVIVCWLLPAVTIASRLYVRPEIWSFLFMAATLAVLSQAQRKPKWLWTLPLIQIFWVNMQGLFVLQWFVVACWLVGETWDQVVGSNDSSSLTWRARLLATLAVPAASFMNPYGARGVLLPVQLFERVRGSERAFYQQFATEFLGLGDLMRESGLSALFSGLNLLLILLFVGGVVTFGLLATQRRAPLFRMLLFFGFAYLAWQMVRNYALFSLVAGFVIRLNLEDLLTYRREDREDDAAAAHFMMRAQFLTGMILLALIIAVPTNLLSAAYFPGRRFGMGREYEQQHQSVRSLRELDIPEHLYVIHEQLAAVCIFHLGPERRVFADARLELYSKETLRKYLEIEVALADDPDAAERLLRKAADQLPALVLDNGYLMNVESYQPKLLDALLHNGRWQCVHFSPSRSESGTAGWDPSDGIAVFVSKDQAEARQLVPADTRLLEQACEVMRRMVEQ
jgi:hypothetical protein